MPVKREFVCKGHGVWETTDKGEVRECPWGCESVQRYFSSPPGYIGVKTRNSDRMQRDIASSLGMTDMSNRNGDSLMVNQAKKYPRGSQCFALPATELAKPGTKANEKKSLDVGQVIAGSQAFDGIHVPRGIQHSAFETAKGAIQGTRRQQTAVFAACDKDGNRIAPPASV